ncbi:uncharacterized protein RCO7_14550 [Rhynchosporium graminicola]|uniref:Uncharacterized protein n=1 Tax=Rhynchosporium graminicola TaxID=2792576 RepID=A0A1E1KNJ7_9HELO|nr:uncharacterized protein RCO7_14550 [Rhynchosporium commune]
MTTDKQSRKTITLPNPERAKQTRAMAGPGRYLHYDEASADEFVEGHHVNLPAF